MLRAATSEVRNEEENFEALRHEVFHKRMSIGQKVDHIMSSPSHSLAVQD
jgi:hypothetical protein